MKFYKRGFLRLAFMLFALQNKRWKELKRAKTKIGRE